MFSTHFTLILLNKSAPNTSEIYLKYIFILFKVFPLLLAYFPVQSSLNHATVKFGVQDFLFI